MLEVGPTDGPTAGFLLADLGADVIKGEPVPEGDATRRLPGFGIGFFGYLNRNKRSFVVNLKTAADADVVVENYGPGTMERLGCGYEQLAAQNPRLLYLALKGFLSSPYERRPALDEVVEFMTGLAYITGPPGQPRRAGASVVDILGDVFGVVAELAALQERAQTGRKANQPHAGHSPQRSAATRVTLPRARSGRLGGRRARPPGRSRAPRASSGSACGSAP